MQEYMAWRKKTLEQMVSESGNRAEYREVMSESLLQVLSFRD
jgi:predicted metal-binding transcription factor (methanogenesis marker protein 9)